MLQNLNFNSYSGTTLYRVVRSALKKELKDLQEVRASIMSRTDIKDPLELPNQILTLTKTLSSVKYDDEPTKSKSDQYD